MSDNCRLSRFRLAKNGWGRALFHQQKPPLFCRCGFSRVCVIPAVYILGARD